MHQSSTPLIDCPSPAAQKLEALRQLFPQAVEVDDRGLIRVNPAAIQMALDPGNPAGVRVEEDGYELRWVGKREAYHQAFVPTTKILSAAHCQSKDWDNTGNLLIKGDNLDALKLLRQSYFGKVKLIYIDPPYNTQSDQFIYRDDFSAKQTEVLTSLGYSADKIDYIKNIYGARTHSGWLSFMYPRLLLARDLLREDGVIFMSIDDNEQAQLKLLCDEVFGQENFVAELPTIMNLKGNNDEFGFAGAHEFTLCYVKQKERATLGEFILDEEESEVWESDDFGPYKRGANLKATGANAPREKRPNLYFPLYITDEGFCNISRKGPLDVEIYPITNGKQMSWRWSIEKFSLEPYNIICIPDGESYSIYKKQRPALGELPSKKPKTIFYKPQYSSGNGTNEIHSLLGGKYFPNPKPLQLIRDFLQIGASGADGPDIALDFFAGSGTTAEAVMRLNAEDGGQRQFILVQIPQPIDPVKQKEAHTFITQTLDRPEATIFEITAERIRRAGAKLQAEQAAKRQAQGELLADDTPPLDTGFRVFELVDDPLGLVHGQALKDANQAQVQRLQQHMATPQTADMQRVLSNLLLAEGLPLTERIQTLVPEHLFVAHDVALLLQALSLDVLQQNLQALQAAGAPLHYLTVYAPWIQDDNLLLGLDTLMDKLGLGREKLRLLG
jgi:adenine-specific DNA-methyltransferase